VQSRWRRGQPEPTVDLEAHYEPRPVTFTKACGLLWNCTDILPGREFDAVIDCKLEPQRRTYAAVARAIAAAIKDKLAALEERPAA
jgi:hypothetical protein